MSTPEAFGSTRVVSRVAAYLRTSVNRPASMGIGQQFASVAQFTVGSEADALFVLIDAGISGRIVDRPAFLMLWRLVESREINAVAVQFTDRLGRRASIIHHFLELCAARDVVVYDVGQGHTLEGYCAGRQSRAAERDYQLTRFRCSFGIRLRVLNRLPPGKIPFGFVAGPGGVIEIDDEAASIVVEIFLLASIGAGRPEIARHLNDLGRFTPNGRRKEHGRQVDGKGVWTASMVDKIITRNFYRGLILYGVTVTERDFDSGRSRVRKGSLAGIVASEEDAYAFIDDEIYDAANLRASINYSTRRRDRQCARRAGTGLLTCACGGGLSYASPTSLSARDAAGLCT